MLLRQRWTKDEYEGHNLHILNLWNLDGKQKARY